MDGGNDELDYSTTIDATVESTCRKDIKRLRTDFHNKRLPEIEDI